MHKNYKKAFTLSEVLITLGVIGVVAAMTISALVQSYRNQVVETRLQKVYSVMNQAIQRAEVDYGAKELWDFTDVDFWDKYFAPYINISKTEVVHSNIDYRIFYFLDGSILTKKENDNHDYFFYPNGKNYNINSLNNRKENTGKILFMFRFAPNDENFHHHKGFIPYAHNWDSVSSPKTGWYGCNAANAKGGAHYCALYIMQNGWKIPKDYPFKVK